MYIEVVKVVVDVIYGGHCGIWWVVLAIAAVEMVSTVVVAMVVLVAMEVRSSSK